MRIYIDIHLDSPLPDGTEPVPASLDEVSFQSDAELYGDDEIHVTSDECDFCTDADDDGNVVLSFRLNGNLEFRIDEYDEDADYYDTLYESVDEHSDDELIGLFKGAIPYEGVLWIDTSDGDEFKEFFNGCKITKATATARIGDQDVELKDGTHFSLA